MPPGERFITLDLPVEIEWVWLVHGEQKSLMDNYRC